MLRSNSYNNDVNVLLFFSRQAFQMFDLVYELGCFAFGSYKEQQIVVSVQCEFCMQVKKSKMCAIWSFGDF